MNENMERAFIVRCTREQLIALGDWMNDNGIFFRKLSDGIREAAHRETFPEEETTQADGTVRP